MRLFADAGLELLLAQVSLPDTLQQAVHDIAFRVSGRVWLTWENVAASPRPGALQLCQPAPVAAYQVSITLEVRASLSELPDALTNTCCAFC